MYELLPQRHKAHGELTEDSTILLPTRNSEEPTFFYFVKDVPKTRSGKIMRRVIKAKALGKDRSDASALSNPEAVSSIPQIN